MSLSRLLNPSSIAVIGGGFWITSILQNLKKSNFAGAVYCVHPKKDEIEGFQCFKSLSDLPHAPDAAFVAINRHATIEAIAELSSLGAGGAVCFASGFAEAAAEDENAGNLQQQLIDAAGDMPILGPNCYGIINMLENAPIWPDQQGLMPVENGVAIIGQSSNMGISLSMQSRGLPIALLAMAGNQANKTMADIGSTLLDDPRITALGLHIEGISDVANFEAMAKKAHKLGKPIVAIKVGKSSQAQAATVSHTASLAGSDAGSRAFLKRLGIAQVENLSVFLETLKLAHFFKKIETGTIGSISCSGGEASLIADIVEDTALTLPALSDTQQHGLRDALGPLVALSNPLDYHTYIWGDVEKMKRAWTAMIDPNMEVLLFAVDFPRTDRCSDAAWQCTIEAAKEVAATGQKTVVFSWMAENISENKAQELIDAGIVPMMGAETTIAALEALYLATPKDFSPVTAAKASKASDLNEAEAKSALQKFGLRVPRSTRAQSPKMASEKAEEIGFPVVLKGEGLAHKSEAGAVRLGLTTKEAVENAAASMSCSSFLVEEMVPNALAEILIGVIKDPAYGYVMTLGAGGVLTELLEDTASLLLPVSADDLEATLNGLRLSKLLDGFRSAPAVNKKAIIDACLSIQDYVLKTHAYEVEVNPLLCGEDFAIAVDALIKGDPT